MSARRAVDGDCGTCQDKSLACQTGALTMAGTVLGGGVRIWSQHQFTTACACPPVWWLPDFIAL